MAVTGLSGGSANTNGGLGGGQYSSANNVGTFTPSNAAGLVQKAYDRLVEFELRATPLLRSVADKKPARQAMPGSSVALQIYNDMAVAKTALSEDVDPAAVSIATPDIVTVTLTTNHKPITINHKPIIIREIPDWFPMDAWQGWVEMRKKRKRPLTERSETRAINKLEALHSAGHDIGELLDRSTINGWLDIYEPKGKTSAGNSEHAAEPTNPMVRAVLASQAKRSADGERFADDWS